MEKKEQTTIEEQQEFSEEPLSLSSSQTAESDSCEKQKKKSKNKKTKEATPQENETNKKKKRKKWPWILLSILLVLAIGITLFIKWQWNNVLAIYYSYVYTPEELVQMQEENEKVMRTLCAKVSDVGIARLPAEAQKMLQNGELSEEDAVAILTGQMTWEEYLMKAEGQEDSVDESAQPSSASRVDQIIAKMYVLRSNYVGRLDSLVSQAWKEYRQGGITKQALINKYISIGSALESECDAQMEALLAELYDELVRTGGDTNLVNDIRNTYLSQKSIKKAELIAKYR